MHQSLRYMVNFLVGKRDAAKSKVKHGISWVETIHKAKGRENTRKSHHSPYSSGHIYLVNLEIILFSPK